MRIAKQASANKILELFMIYRAALIVLVSCLCLNASHAQAYKHKALAENLGALAVSKRWCTEYEVDLEGGIRLAIEKGINPLKGEFNSIVEKTKETMEGYLESLGASKFCAINYNRYKPGGEVPGFMVKK